MRLYRWYANEPLKKQRSYGQKEQVRSEDCLFPVAGFLIAERQSTVKDALHRAAASSLTVGCLCSAEICLRDGDKTMLYNEAIGKFNKSRPFSRAVPLWERGGGVRGIPVKVFTSSPHNASSISNCGRNVATRGKLIASPTNQTGKFTYRWRNYGLFMVYLWRFFVSTNRVMTYMMYFLETFL